VVSTAISAGSVILVVESPSVRNLIGTLLEKEGFTTVLEDVPRGRHTLAQAGHTVAMLITNEPWRFEPFPENVAVLYVSGAPNREFLERHHAGQLRFLQKPFHLQELILSVHLLRQQVA
jgi:hypothetical protein